MEVIFISGGSSGIGLATVKRFLGKGFKVVTCGRDRKKWLSALDADQRLTDVEFIEADLSGADQITALFDQIKSKYKFIDVAVNNASPELVSGGPFAEQTIDALRKTMESDLLSHMHCMKCELQLMRSGSCIVNVTSVNGIRPTPNASAYSAAKHGLEGLTKSVALEAIKSGIRINSIAPGVTWTPRWQRKLEADPRERENISNLVPVGRFAQADEIAKAIVWLCSEDSSYIVGHTLVIDGGLSLL